MTTGETSRRQNHATTMILQKTFFYWVHRCKARPRLRTKPRPWHLRCLRFQTAQRRLLRVGVLGQVWPGTDASKSHRKQTGDDAGAESCPEHRVKCPRSGRFCQFQRFGCNKNYKHQIREKSGERKKKRKISDDVRFFLCLIKRGQRVTYDAR